MGHGCDMVWHWWLMTVKCFDFGGHQCYIAFWAIVAYLEKVEWECDYMCIFHVFKSFLVLLCYYMILKNWPFHRVNRSKTAFDKDSAKISTFYSRRRFNNSALAGYYNGYAAEGPMLKFRVKFAVEDRKWQLIKTFLTVNRRFFNAGISAQQKADTHKSNNPNAHVLMNFNEF